MYQSEVFEKPWWRHPEKTRTTCVDCGRVAFRSQEEAKARVLHIRNKYPKSKPMKAYLRKRCGWWHLKPAGRKR